MKSRIKLLMASMAVAVLGLMAVPTAAFAASTVVTPSNMQSWFFYNDENDTIDNTLGSFVSGPATPPLGSGSVQMSVSGTQRKNIATYQFGGTTLSDITELKYSTYNPLAGNGAGIGSQRSAYLQFNVDFNGSDTWQRRLTFVPVNNGVVTQDSWQEWDAINSGNALWTYSGATWPVTGGAGSTPKTWSQILSDYSGVRIRISDPFLGLRVGEPYANGYTENIDKVVFGAASSTKVFDFEPTISPTTKQSCKNDGWKTFNTPVFKNQGDCVSFIVSQN